MRSSIWPHSQYVVPSLKTAMPPILMSCPAQIPKAGSRLPATLLILRFRAFANRYRRNARPAPPILAPTVTEDCTTLTDRGLGWKRGSVLLYPLGLVKRLQKSLRTRQTPQSPRKPRHHCTSPTRHLFHLHRHHCRTPRSVHPPRRMALSVYPRR